MWWASRARPILWRERFAKFRLDGLNDEPRCGAPRKIGRPHRRDHHQDTGDNASGRDALDYAPNGESIGCVGVLVASQLASFRSPIAPKTFKLSSDPQFVEKVRDIGGLHLDPLENTLVICVDENSQIHPLDQTQPLLPMRPGQVERRTHDCMGHGTTTLFAGLIAAVTAKTDSKAGSVIGKCMPRHPTQELRNFSTSWSTTSR